MERERRKARRRATGHTAVLLALVSGLVAAPPALADRGDPLREAVRNGTTSGETEIIGRIGASPGKGGYVTRQSNVQEGPGAGGAATYGCRAPEGGTAGGSAPCLRGSNLAGGFAFEFATTSGPAGLFSVGDPGQLDPAPPFLTNATGLVRNLNAERVGGMTAEQIIAKAKEGLAAVPGPPGPPGPPGERGPQGEQGETGPSDGYGIAGGFESFAIGDTTEKDIVSLDLPEGPYLVTVTGNVEWPDTGINTAVDAFSCTVYRSPSTFLEATTGALGPTADGETAMPQHRLAFTFPITIGPGATGIRLACRATLASGAWAARGSITAVRVGELHVQTP